MSRLDKAIEEAEAAVETHGKKMMEIAETLGKEMARLGAEVAWLRSVLKEVEADSRLLAATGKANYLSAFNRNIITTIGARARNGLAFKCVALCEDVCGPARCQLPSGHPGLHGHVDNDEKGRTRWGEDENYDPLEPRSRQDARESSVSARGFPRGQSQPHESRWKDYHNVDEASASPRSSTSVASTSPSHLPHSRRQPMTDIRPPHDYDPLCKCDVCRYELHLRSLPGAAADDGDEVLTMREETDLSAKLKKANNLVARLTAQVERMRVQTAQMGRDWDADIELTARAQARERVVQARVETASRDLRSIGGLTSDRRLRLYLLRVLATLRGEVEESDPLAPKPPRPIAFVHGTIAEDVKVDIYKLTTDDDEKETP